MVPEDLFGPIKAEDNMSQEWWWTAYGVLLRKFASESEAEEALLSETNPVVFITGQGWSFEVKKSDISIFLRTLNTHA